MKIKELPEQDRPRERFIKKGPEALSDAELFAILLRTGARGKKNEEGILEGSENVMDVSSRLMNEYGLNKIFDCSLTELQEINGIGPAKAMQILAISEMNKRINQAKTPITQITRAEDVFRLMHEELKDKKEEHFYVILLDVKNKIIGKHLITKGILDASIIHPREVFKPAIKNSASKIILVHNHPSGNPEPSEEDLDKTHKLMAVGESLGIKVVDHVIIGRVGFTSWLEMPKRVNKQ